VNRYDYDGASAPQRTVITAAAAVAALCVAFLIGYASHGRSHPAAAPNNPPSQAPPPAPTSTVARPASPAAAQSARPASGMHRNTVGVIVGYSHDQAGAVAAAGNYTASLYVHANRASDRELAVLSTIATSPADAQRMARDFATEDQALARLLDVATLQSDGVIAYGHPQGYRVETVTPAAATVDVYVAGGQGLAEAPSDSGAAGATFYEVDQVQLVWQRGDWRLANWSHLVEDNSPALGSTSAEGYLPFPIGEES